MKRIFCAVLAVCAVMAGSVCAWGDVAIDAEHFPDEVFREFVSSNFDADNDGILNDDEIIEITNISVFGRGIKSLQGIEHFKSLTELDCSYNYLTFLDLSLNNALTELYCGSNQLEELDISKNTQLTGLWCYGNQLSKLEINNNSELSQLFCNNNHLAALDVSRNNALKVLNCDSQIIAVSSLNATESNDYPYSFNLLSLNTSIAISSIFSMDVRDSRDLKVDYRMEDSAIYFASSPSAISYRYDIQKQGDPIYMDVAVMVHGLSPASSYRFIMSDTLRNEIISVFQDISEDDIHQLADNEILSRTWQIASYDVMEFFDLQESPALIIPHIRPRHSGLYVIRLNLANTENVDKGTTIALRGIFSNLSVNTSALQEVQYVFFDEKSTIIKEVPENKIIYVAFKTATGTDIRVVVTIPLRLAQGTVMPVEEERHEELRETIAQEMSSIDIDAGEIRFIHEEQITQAKDPSSGMLHNAKENGYALIGKLNTISADEEGYYVLKIVLSDDLFNLIEGVNVNEVVVDNFSNYDVANTNKSSVKKSFLSGLLGTWEILTVNGKKLDKFSFREFLMIGFLNAGEPFTLYLARRLVPDMASFIAAVLGAGGCNAGLGLAGVSAVVFILMRKNRR